MKLKELTRCALGIALVFLATFLIKIPAAHGYFNLGDAMIFIFASYLSPTASFLLGGIGSSLADLSGGFAQYALFTFIIKGIEAAFVATLRKHQKPVCLSYIVGGTWMILGYFLCDVIIYQQFEIAFANSLMNLIQAISGILLAWVFIRRIKLK